LNTFLSEKFGVQTVIHEARIKHLIDDAPPAGGGYVLYWMQQAQRTEYNHALCFSLQKARELNLPLVVGFVLIPDFPEANLRHYRFMLQGLADVRDNLEKAEIPFVLQSGEMVQGVLELAREAAWVVTDVGYLQVQRDWRKQLAGSLSCPFTAVETDIIVPVGSASEKQEFAARTLRPKLARVKEAFLDTVPVLQGMGRPQELPARDAGEIDFESMLSWISVDESVPAVSGFKGGEGAAKELLNEFVSADLQDYEKSANDPVSQCTSHMSPYLHFGQISPLEIYKQVKASNAPESSKSAFLEQLLVRRELSINFVYYNSGYRDYEKAVPDWALQSLDKHSSDPRPYLYSREDFEQARTHDPYWNAAQIEMLKTGKMHNYMRMYWGKKIIEWTEHPEEAFRIMLYLNNKYELDGRDPNGFAGVAWCFGRHDRPWQERQVFGKIRYMNARGLKRKFKIDEYVGRIAGFPYPD